MTTRRPFASTSMTPECQTAHFKKQAAGARRGAGSYRGDETEFGPLNLCGPRGKDRCSC